MIVAIYARVSTSEQELNNQITQLEQLAKFRGYLVHGIYTDKASGKDGNRPGWQKLLKDAKNRNFSRVLVVSISRVMRSVIHLNNCLIELDGYHVDIEAADIGVIDLKSASGKLTFQILGAVAEWEREIIRERTRAGINYRRLKGVQLGRPVIHKVNIDLAARLILNGHTWAEAAEKLNVPRSALTNRRKQIHELMARYKEAGEGAKK